MNVTISLSVDRLGILPVNPLGNESFNSINCQNWSSLPFPDPFGGPSQKCNWTTDSAMHVRSVYRTAGMVPGKVSAAACTRRLSSALSHQPLCVSASVRSGLGRRAKERQQGRVLVADEPPR